MYLFHFRIFVFFLLSVVAVGKQVSRVSALRNTDPAQLLLDLLPRRFKFTELGMTPGCLHDDILKALQGHPVLKEAGGHPGTLVSTDALPLSRFSGSSLHDWFYISFCFRVGRKHEHCVLK